MAKQDVNTLIINTGAAQTSVKELRQQLKLLKDTLLSTQQGTKEYNMAMSQAAEITHTLREQTEYINATAMDFGQIVSNVNSALGGFVGGIQLVNASMNLFGIENEDVIKSLKQMQNLMAITQALPAIDNAMHGFRKLGIAIKVAALEMNGLKAALVSTGIGAVAVGLGLLIQHWDDVTAAMQRWGIIHEDTKKKLEEQVKSLDEWNKQLEKIRTELLTQETSDKLDKMNKKSRESYEDLTKTLKRLEIQYKAVEAERQVEWRTNGQFSERARELSITFNELTEQIDSLRKAQQAILNDSASYIPDVEPLEKWVKELEQTTKEAISALDPFISLQDRLKDDSSPYEIPVKVVVQEDEESAEDEAQKLADSIRKKIETTVESLRNAFRTPEEQYNEEIAALQTALNTKLISQEEYYRLVDGLNREQTAREVMRYQTAASAIGSIFSSLGDLMEEGSEEAKAFQIMGATINMLAGITAAISGLFTTKSGPWDIALAALQATAIAASGGATIAKMAKTTKNNATSTSKYSVSSGAITNMTAPIQYTQDVQGATIQDSIKDTRVYVLEGDITSTQRRVSVVENEATY